MERKDLKTRIQTEEDFILAPKYGNSLKKMVNKNSDGVKDDIIAKVLDVTPEEVNDLYEEAISELRKGMLGKDDEE